MVSLIPLFPIRYKATVQAVYESGKASLRYDDGDKWTGSAAVVYLLNPPVRYKAVDNIAIYQ